MSQGAIVVGAHVNGLGVIRALASHGIPIAVISTRSFDIAQHSRWVSERHDLFRLHEQQDALIELLEWNATRWLGWAIFPTNDDAVTALAQHHERLSRSYRLTVQPWEIVSHIVDKDRMQALAQRVGLELPTCFGATTAQTAARDDLHYPLVVKPIQHDHLISCFGAKLFLAHDAEQLRMAIDRLTQAGLRGLVFDFVPGPDSNLYVYCVYIDAHGEPSPGVTVRKLRQNPPFIGGARAAEIVPEIHLLREATVELLRRAGFRGMAFAEFKLDPRSGRFLFIEVNGRAVLFNSLLPPTGIDLVTMTWSDFALDRSIRLQPTNWDGTWVHLQADIRCWFAYRDIEQLSLSEFLAPYRRPKTFAVWSASDPKPFIAQTALAARGALAALGRERHQPAPPQRGSGARLR
jgi:predicted ATP-grasp superfamily ATP-dependent carboligase